MWRADRCGLGFAKSRAEWRGPVFAKVDPEKAKLGRWLPGSGQPAAAPKQSQRPSRLPGPWRAGYALRVWSLLICTVKNSRTRFEDDFGALVAWRHRRDQRRQFASGWEVATFQKPVGSFIRDAALIYGDVR